MRTVRLELMRPDEICQVLREKSIAYLPVGPLEWHGPAMPYGTDAMAAGESARRTAMITGGAVVPTMFMGTETPRDNEFLQTAGLQPDTDVVGMDFPKNSIPSMYLRAELFAVMLREQVRLLVNLGFKLIVIVNGHGAVAQEEAIHRIAKETTAETDSTVIGVRATYALKEGDLNGGHGSVKETAVQMYLNGGSVDLSKFPPREEPLRMPDYGILNLFGPHFPKDMIMDPDPRDATAELGKQYLEHGAEKNAGIVEEVWKQLLEEQNK